MYSYVSVCSLCLYPAYATRSTVVWCFSEDPEIPGKFDSPRKVVSCSLFLELREMATVNFRKCTPEFLVDTVN